MTLLLCLRRRCMLMSVTLTTMCVANICPVYDINIYQFTFDFTFIFCQCAIKVFLIICALFYNFLHKPSAENVSHQFRSLYKSYHQRKEILGWTPERGNTVRIYVTLQTICPHRMRRIWAVHHLVNLLLH